MRWVAAVGRLVGAIVAAGAWGGARLDGWSGALPALLLWVGVTGALHLDGLGDIPDARGAAHKANDRPIPALSDPHDGSFQAGAFASPSRAMLVLLPALIPPQSSLSISPAPLAAPTTGSAHRA